MSTKCVSNDYSVCVVHKSCSSSEDAREKQMPHVVVHRSSLKPGKFFNVSFFFPENIAPELIHFDNEQKAIRNAEKWLKKALKMKK